MDVTGITPRVLLLATGGTISTVRSPETRELLTRKTGSELVSSIPGLTRICSVEIVQYDNTASMDISPTRIMEISVMLRQALLREEITGAVVTLGTDTLEEVAYLLGITVSSSKPVVVTGAMRGGGLLGEDGLRNLQAALCVASSPLSSNMGTVVVANDEIHSAQHVAKTHSLSLSAFQSPVTGPIGEIWNDTVLYHSAPLRRLHIPCTNLEANVDLIKVVSGMDGRYARASVVSGAKAIVVETAGAGAMPGALQHELTEASKQGVVIGLTTRCFAGPAGFFGKAPPGVFSFPGLPGPKARLLLMAALGASGEDRDLLQRLLSQATL